MEASIENQLTDQITPSGRQAVVAFPLDLKNITGPRKRCMALCFHFCLKGHTALGFGALSYESISLFNEHGWKDFVQVKYKDSHKYPSKLCCFLLTS